MGPNPVRLYNSPIQTRRQDFERDFNLKKSNGNDALWIASLTPAARHRLSESGTHHRHKIDLT